MTIDRPIIIIGTGRCGSTIFHEILSHHEEVDWMSGLLGKYPTKPFLNRLLLNLTSIPLMKNIIRKKLKPRESYRYWELLSTGFSEPCRDLKADDMTLKSRRNIIDGMSKIMTKRDRRLLIKITGWPRTGFLSEVFPDAKFIHILRDGRAVVNSLINVEFWSGWKGPSNWRWGDLSPDQRQEWVNNDRSFTILAAIEWKIQLDAMRKALSNLNQKNVLECKYEYFIENPVEAFKQVCQFCDLTFNERFINTIKSFELKNMNYKWKENLSEPEQNKLVNCLRDELINNGYPI